MKNCLLIVLIFIYFSPLVKGQDIHWSQFNDNQLFQNPGQAGHFKGDYRFIGNFRSQWKAVTVPFSTLSLSADSKLPSMPKLGYGILFFHDVVGDGKFRTIEVQANVNYLIKLSKDSMHTIRPGINLGMNHRQINWDKLYFDNQFNGVYYDPSLPTGELYQNDKKTNFSLGLGSVYEFQKKRINLLAGIGVFNLNQPNHGFYNSKIKRDIRTNAFVKFSYPIGFDWDLIPSVQFSVQGKYRELIFGSSVKYTLVNKLGDYKALYAGFWFRNKDATYLSIGMDYQNWFVGVSYDINVSKLVPASNARGAFEVAVRYILFRFKPKKVYHRVCPDYI
jgi:type IX secretion system PorP/SprF family membrane protein